MKRRRLCLIILGLSIIMLSGCGNDSASVQTTEESVKESEVEEISTQADIQEQLDDLQDQVNQIGAEIGEIFGSLDSKTVDQSSDSEVRETVADTKDEQPTEADIQAPINGIRPEFKQAMDSYEAFFDEYCEFMETFENSDNSVSMMLEYADFMTRYTEAMNDLEELKDSDMSTEETSYYIEVMNRINVKLLEVAQ